MIARAEARVGRDAELAQATNDMLRSDIQRARQIIAEKGLRGLFDALDRGELLPGVLVSLGLAGAYQGKPSESD
jgi:hypothetical protein